MAVCPQWKTSDSTRKSAPTSVGTGSATYAPSHLRRQIRTKLHRGQVDQNWSNLVRKKSTSSEFHTHTPPTRPVLWECESQAYLAESAKCGPSWFRGFSGLLPML